MVKITYNMSFLCIQLLFFYFSLASCEKNLEGTITKANTAEKRDSSVSDSYVPPSSSPTDAPQASGYSAPAKPVKDTKVQKFKLLVVLALFCLMTLGVAWIFIRIVTFASLGAAGTTRSLTSFWRSPYSMLPDWEWASLASKVLDSNVLPEILETIRKSSK